MANWKRTIPFQVDVAGVIHIMSTALYSRPEAAVRELIQNAHDAIMRRRHGELAYRGRIDIVQNPGRRTLEFRDDGLGLSVEEAERYLGTLGIGLTGLLKGRLESAPRGAEGEGKDLIGMFGIGLFSAFMLADRLVVESRRAEEGEGVRWAAGSGSRIELSSFEKETCGTVVRLELKPEFSWLAEDEERLEQVVKEYADFLPVSIHLNESPTRVNVMHAVWFEPTPDHESIELELAAYFDETPLDVIPIRIDDTVSITGALYVSPRRTPGFSGESVVTATVRRMVISSRIEGLVPHWAAFLRGVLELPEASPTTSREDLVRDEVFLHAARALEEKLYEHFETLAARDPSRWQAILSWHRYWLAGAALGEPRLRQLLRSTYRFATSHGRRTFEEIVSASDADPLYETEFDRVIWYNTDRRQEHWIDSLFGDDTAPCVHTLRTFEESLLVAMAEESETQEAIDVRAAAPSSPGFARDLLGASDLEPLPESWQRFFSAAEASIQCGMLRTSQPVVAFLNEQHELMQTFEDLKRGGVVPAGFQRLIDRHFDGQQRPRHEIILNRRHRLVERALEQGPGTPLASVLRLLVWQGLGAAGAPIHGEARRQQVEDLDWIAECLWGRD